MKAQEQRIEEVCRDVESLLKKKNNDYGNSFSIQFEKYGVMSAMIRMDDKMRRLENLMKGTLAQVDESIEDTLLDLVGYGTLALVELRKQKEF
ncbi:nucleotide modification associated domain-containing protein [Paenibacillus sp. NPDC057886]|uniref:nucleotide modification associated domain-containing protein n=1 Tax=Paenibacillus sp. NPDC057886 TaxID=3346270 RepID=UPI003694CC16